MSAIADTAESLINKEWEDCSSFVKYCYAVHNINIPRGSAEIFNKGIKSNGKRGDIVCWAGHVGICDGNGKVIHAYHKNSIVCKDSINDVSAWDKRSVKGYVTYN